MKYPKLRELKEAIRSLIKGPYTSRYPAVPCIPYERFRGRPYYYEKDCIGCTACVQVCPPRALEYKDEVGNGQGIRRFIVHWDICICCGQCEASCPTKKGIMLSREFDYATVKSRRALTQQIEKELMLCACCGEPIVPRDQYTWVAERLGPLLFSNASLIMWYIQHLRETAKRIFLHPSADGLKRGDRLSILCPRCRRSAVVRS